MVAALQPALSPLATLSAVNSASLAPSSQLAVPVLQDGQLLGIVFVYSARDTSQPHRADLADRTAAAASCLKAAAAALECSPSGQGVEEPALLVTYRSRDQAVLANGQYVTRGVAGAVLWWALRQRQATGREQFSYHELRMDGSLRLPEHRDNLSARLILLRERLEARCPLIAVDRVGRGRFSIAVRGSVNLHQI